MKRKVIRWAALLTGAVVMIFAVINILAFRELKGLTEKITGESDVQITVKAYHTGQSVQVTDPAAVREICLGVSQLQYGGIYWGREWISGEKTGYSVVVSSDDLFAVFILDPPARDRMTNVDFPVSIKNCQALYDGVEAVFQNQ